VLYSIQVFGKQEVIIIKYSNKPEKDKLYTQIYEFCKHIAGQSKIAAIAQVDKYSTSPNEHFIYEIIVIIHNFQPRLMSYLKLIMNKTVFIFAIDQWIFERDIDRGLLGEAIAGKIVFPYKPLYGETYLQEKEIALKKRLTIELLENLIVSFPELSQSMQIMPQYFLYEIILNRIRVFPLLAYEIGDLAKCIIKNEEQALESYKTVLKQLEDQEKILIKNNYISLTKKFISQTQAPKIRIVNRAKNAPRTLFTVLFGVLPQLMNIASQNAKSFLRTQKINWTLQPDTTYKAIEPKKFVYIPTSKGLVSLSEKTDVKEFAQKILLKGQKGDVEVKPAGGILNNVYIIKAGETKVIAKQFKDWSMLKWFPLTLWSFGTFAVSGQARLAKEVAIGEFLRKKGFNVPKILHASNAKRVVFMEFIQGKNLGEIIKEYADATGDEANNDYALRIIEKIGETLAKIHGYNVSLGDTKPDNVLVTSDEKIFLVDFEQAKKDGDKAWDIAVFLYYCGHYLQPFDSELKAEYLTEAFINGYIKSGGKTDYIRKAGLTKYTRVFSIFTMPSIITAIAKTCKKA